MYLNFEKLNPKLKLCKLEFASITNFGIGLEVMKTSRPVLANE